MTKKELIDRLEVLEDDAEIFLDGGNGELINLHHVAIYKCDAPAFALLESPDYDA